MNNFNTYSGHILPVSRVGHQHERDQFHRSTGAKFIRSRRSKSIRERKLSHRVALTHIIIWVTAMLVHSLGNHGRQNMIHAWYYPLRSVLKGSAVDSHKQTQRSCLLSLPQVRVCIACAASLESFYDFIAGLFSQVCLFVCFAFMGVVPSTPRLQILSLLFTSC